MADGLVLPGYFTPTPSKNHVNVGQISEGAGDEIGDDAFHRIEEDLDWLETDGAAPNEHLIC